MGCMSTAHASFAMHALKKSFCFPFFLLSCKFLEGHSFTGSVFRIIQLGNSSYDLKGKNILINVTRAASNYGAVYLTLLAIKPGGDSHMKVTGMLVGKLELTP